MGMNIRASLVFLVAFTAANLFSAFSADFNKKTCGGMCMKVLRRSGKVLFRRCRNNTSFANAFTVELDDMKQYGANGKEIKGGRSVSNFKTQDFTVGTLNKSAILQGLKVMKLSLTANLRAQKANLYVDLYVICENGTIKFEEDEIAMKNGSLKFFVKLENYTSSEAKEIELGLVVKGRKGQKPSKDIDIKGSDGNSKKLPRNMPCRKGGKCGKHFRFGSGAKDDDEMSAASKCKINGKFANFSSSDYPKLETTGNKHRLVFRVPADQFSKTIEVDPGVTLGDTIEEDDENVDNKDDKNDKDNKDNKDDAVSLQLNLLLLFVVLAAIFTLN